MNSEFSSKNFSNRLFLTVVISIIIVAVVVGIQLLQSSSSQQLNYFDDDRTVGPDDAPIQIVKFMDYQCPYCVRYANQVLPTIKERYVASGKIQYAIRDYSLNFHPQAKGAAVAAHCAGKQDKYWDMHSLLVANSRKLHDEIYLELAQDIDLDLTRFSECQGNPESNDKVTADFEYGKDIGIRGTPSFYIGRIEGDKIVDVVNVRGARSIDVFDRAIQQVIQGGEG